MEAANLASTLARIAQSCQPASVTGSESGALTGSDGSTAGVGQATRAHFTFTDLLRSADGGAYTETTQSGALTGDG